MKDDPLKHLLRAAAFSISVAFVGFFGSAPTRAQDTPPEHLWEKVQASGVLRAGAGLAPPDLMKDPKTGEYSGIFVDLLRAFAKDQLGGVKVEFVDTNWDNMIAGLQSSKWDVAMAINRKPKRAMVIHFSEPVRFFEISMVYNKSNPKFTGPDFATNFDRDDITYAAVAGTAEEQALSDRVKNAKILRLPNIDDVRLAVTTHRADAAVADAVTNQLFANVNKDWSATVVPEPALAKQGIAYGFRRDVPMDDIEALNIFIDEAVAKGEVKTLTEKYIAATQ